MHRTSSVGADDPGDPSGSASQRRAGVVAPYRGGTVRYENHPEGIPQFSIFIKIAHPYTPHRSGSPSEKGREG